MTDTKFDKSGALYQGMVSCFQQVEPDFEGDTISLDADWRKFLGFDSLDEVELHMAIEDYFRIDHVNASEFEEIKTFGDIMGWLEKEVDKDFRP